MERETKEWVLLIGKIREGTQSECHLSWVGKNDRIAVNRERGKAARLKQPREHSQEIGERTEEELTLASWHVNSTFPGLPQSVLLTVLSDKHCSCYG